jgi:hypothetical protein
MSINKNIRNIFDRINPELRLKRVQVGLLYTAVQLENGSTGVAFNFPRQCCGPSLTAGGRSFKGRNALEIVHSLGSENLFDSSLALATVNALVSSMGLPEDALCKDVLEVIDIMDGESICMVGCFLPIMEKLKDRRVEIKVVDLEIKPGALPEEFAFTLLRKSQIALITATALINSTMDSLLEASEFCREVVILGPSTPLVPQAFKDTPVTCIAGIMVDKPDEVFRIIGEGGGFRLFRPYTRKFTLRL